MSYNYEVGIIAAITELKDRNRTGSSSIAIKKSMQAAMPTDKKWRNHIFLAALKKAVDNGYLVQIKNSYKLSVDYKKRALAAAARQKKKVESEGDDQDGRLFQSITDKNLSARVIRSMNRRDGCLVLRGVNDWRKKSWNRLGEMIGQSVRIPKIVIGHHDALATSTFFTNLQNNQSITALDLSGVALGGTGKIIDLAPFIRNNPLLESLELNGCNIGSDNINILSQSLLDRAHDTIWNLELKENYVGEDNLGLLVQALGGSKALRRLHLSGNNIGRRGCALIANMLKNPQSNLRSLELGKIRDMDDVSAKYFAVALAQNTNLKQLHIDSLDTNLGPLLELVCDSSSIEGIIGSNHTLTILGFNGGTSKKKLWGSRDQFLRGCVTFNDSDGKRYKSIRCKILWSHARGHVNIGDLSIPHGVMPTILSWFGQEYGNKEFYIDRRVNQIGEYRLGSIYPILRSMPDLIHNNEKGEHQDNPDRGPGSLVQCVEYNYREDRGPGSLAEDIE